MNIVFRTDASFQIGIGHVMRCLTLADELRVSGAQCQFICREHPGNLIAQIRQRGFKVNVLPTATEASITNEGVADAPSNYADWLGADWATDAEQAKVNVGASTVDWLIVDHYALDARWEQALKPFCRKLMVVDDLADRTHDCDFLLDQNLGRDVRDYSELVPERCIVLAGPYYALLRPEFAALRDASLRRRAAPKLNHLLITMGGVDQGNATGKVLEVLQDCTLPKGMRITVVMGPHAPWLERVKLLANRMPQPINVKVNVNNMAQLMAESDLAIGAAGSTSWERCCLGLPSIVNIQAANQQLIANALELSGAVKVFNIAVNVQLMFELFEEVLSDNNGLQKMSASAAVIADGKGVKRVVAELHKSFLI